MTKTKHQTSKRSSEVRILPAVIGVGAILFALKAGGIAFSARAAETAEPPAAPPAAAAEAPAPATPPAGNLPFKPAAAPAARATPAPKAQPTTAVESGALPEPGAPANPTLLPNGQPDPLAAINAALPNQAGKPLIAQPDPAAVPKGLPSDLSGAGVTPAEMDVLTSLSDRRDVLDQRQRELDLKANMIAAAEKRVDDKITQLKTLQTTIEKLMGQRDQKEIEQLDGLVRIYTAMKPKDAARIFSTLDGDVRIGVAGRMKADTMAGIMSSLPADVAQKMTVDLASRFKMTPEIQAQATAAVNAAVPAQGAASAAAPRPAVP